MRCFIGSILAGIVLFIWGAISWMVLPWHSQTLHDFSNPQAVVSAVTQSGVYAYPSPSKFQDQPQTPQSLIFVSVQRERSISMVVPLLISLATQIIAAIFVLWLLSMTSGLSYIGRVFFVVIFGFAAGIVTYVPYWNWFGFDTQFILVEFADLIIGWFLAGLILAGFYCNKVK